MNLFDTLPGSFFNCLASGSSNRIYADCLLLIYHEYDREITYRIPRSQVRDALAVYLMEHQIEHLEEEPEELTGRELAPYAGNIQTALAAEQLPEEQERGLMCWYDNNDTLSWKVCSARFGVEEKDGILWGVADCRIDSPLEGEELQQLVSYLSGQASDGWGEGFEQRPISLNGEELYVHLWQGQNWEMSATEPEQKESLGIGMAP